MTVMGPTPSRELAELAIVIVSRARTSRRVAGLAQEVTRVGLDYDGRYRNLPDVVALRRAREERS